MVFNILTRVDFDYGYLDFVLQPADYSIVGISINTALEIEYSTWQQYVRERFTGREDRYVIAYMFERSLATRATRIASLACEPVLRRIHRTSHSGTQQIRLSIGTSSPLYIIGKLDCHIIFFIRKELSIVTSSPT